AFFSARLRRKALITNLLTFGLFGLMMLVSFQINKLGAILLQNMDKFSKMLYSETGNGECRTFLF
ncbi:MAG: hypothetical protein RSG96_09335, partial [Clostridia bacterium]